MVYQLGCMETDEIMRRMGLGDNRNKDGVQILNIFMLAVTNLH